MISNDREYRSFDFEQSDDEKMIITGKAVVFNTPTVLYEIDGIQYKEVIAPGALDGVDLSDVVLVIDHEGKPAARTKNSTLKLEVRNDGLYIEADLSKNATGRELHEDIKNGFYQSMSFAFTVETDEYNRDTRTRTIKKVKRLYDVSAVSFPAYKNTSISARSFFEAEAEKEQKAKELAELRQKLILLCDL
ncbi:MAG: HK97 family phage prohead protease [Clostridiaceae bacterium]|nr:HK97 family phage prohead protease [Clostridiaceae bacterium]